VVIYRGYWLSSPFEQETRVVQQWRRAAPTQNWYVTPDFAGLFEPPSGGQERSGDRLGRPRIRLAPTSTPGIASRARLPHCLSRDRGARASRLGAVDVALEKPPFVALALACLLTAAPAGALVTVTDPDDGSVFLDLYRPTGKLDETSLSGFELLISSRIGEFRANDQYLISGEATEETTSIAHDLGAVEDLSGTPFNFTIEHNLTGGRNLTFAVTNLLTSTTEVLCWGENCEPGSTSVETLAGIPPIASYNGLQIQVRAQDVVGSSAQVTITSLSGVATAGADFFDETVVPTSPGTISPLDAGRRGQWMLGDSLDLVENEWALEGSVTLSRPDEALADLTKVRLAVDLVRDPKLPFIEAPEPATPLLFVVGAGVLGLSSLRRQRHTALRAPEFSATRPSRCAAARRFP
jgi:hypothetical protein